MYSCDCPPRTSLDVIGLTGEGASRPPAAHPPSHPKDAPPRLPCAPAGLIPV